MKFLKFAQTVCTVATVNVRSSQTLKWESQTRNASTLCKVPLLENSNANANANESTNTYGSLLQGSTGIRTLNQAHARILINGLDQNMFLSAKLVNMYAKWGSLQNARLVFDKMYNPNAFLWNTMIRAYARNGHCEPTLRLYYQMQRAGIQPDNFTFPFALKACAGLSALQEGKEIHYRIVINGIRSDVFVEAGLIDMYAKCGRIDDARQVFDKMSRRDVVSWTAMIDGYVRNGQADEALVLFNQMQSAGVKPNRVTMLSVLSACAHLGALQQGKWIHDYIVRSGFESGVSVGTALIDMYAKCGSIEIARQLFDKMSERDVVLWSAMIAGYGMHGRGEDAVAVFLQMQRTGARPNHVTFTCVLSACSHAGLVDLGWQYFDCMSRDYCITPRVKHYACMVDLLGRAGRLEEAQDFINKMPLEPDAGVWGALLGACRIHCNIELGERVAEHLFYLQPTHAGYYVLMSNIYAAAGRWNDVAKVRSMMTDRGLKKTPGCSLIEVNNRVHAFLVGDRSHPQSQKIYAMLECLADQMKDAGYVPDTNFVLHDAEEEVKEHTLCTHGKKMAIAFGLVGFPWNPYQDHKNPSCLW